MNILAERQKTHGDPTAGHRLMWRWLAEAFPLLMRSELDDASKWEVVMSMYKTTRIIKGDPSEADHYLDNKGYITLAEQREVQSNEQWILHRDRIELEEDKWEERTDAE